MPEHYWPNSMKNLIEFFFLFWFSIYKLKNQCDLVNPSGGTCDQIILQSNLLKTFSAITQEQEFSQIWDWYRKIDNNTNFFRTFPTKINDKILEKPYFWVIVFTNVAMYNCSGPAAFKC